MGLLNHISNLKSKGGLLALASQFENSELKFNQWASSKNFSVCSIFAKQEAFYYVCHCSGFDLTSIVNSVSSEDFWEGTISDKNNISVFQDAELSPFFQLFSNSLKNFISKISVISFTCNDEQFYFLCANTDLKSEELVSLKCDLIEIVSKKNKNPEQNSDRFTNSIDKGLEISSANLFILSAKLSLDTAFNQFDKKLKDLISSTAMNSILARISPLFASPNCCSLCSNDEIKLVLFAAEEIDEKLLQFHINSSLKSFFENDKDSNILILTAGLCPNLKGTTAFLNQD